MAENKTQPTLVSVDDYIQELADARRKAEAHQLVDLYREITGMEPVMWGPSIIGFGTYTYKYASGRSGTVCAAGFAPRKANVTIYLMDGVDSHVEDLAALGPYTHGQGCLYIKRLEQVDLGVLEALIRRSFTTLQDS